MGEQLSPHKDKEGKDEPAHLAGEHERDPEDGSDDTEKVSDDTRKELYRLATVHEERLAADLSVTSSVPKPPKMDPDIYH